jgi:protein CpxP
MKRSNILSIVALGAALALAPSLRAQDASPSPATSGSNAYGGRQGARGGRGGENINMLTQELSLTPDEVAKITPILDQLRTDAQALRNDTSVAQQDRMTKMRDLRDKANAQIRTLLTTDQQTKFDALLTQMRNRRGNRGGGGGNGGGAPAASATP